MTTVNTTQPHNSLLSSSLVLYLMPLVRSLFTTQEFHSCAGRRRERMLFSRRRAYVPNRERALRTFTFAQRLSFVSSLLCCGWFRVISEVLCHFDIAAAMFVTIIAWWVDSCAFGLFSTTTDGDKYRDDCEVSWKWIKVVALKTHSSYGILKIYRSDYEVHSGYLIESNKFMTMASHCKTFRLAAESAKVVASTTTAKLPITVLKTSRLWM